jgi:hypothetical protein
MTFVGLFYEIANTSAKREQGSVYMEKSCPKRHPTPRGNFTVRLHGKSLLWLEASSLVFDC